MKFHQLPQGARFTFRDGTYRKISPLKAENEADTTHKLIPRSASVTRLGDDPTTTRPAPALPADVPGAALETAAWDIVDRCRSSCAGIDPPLSPAQQAQVIAAVEVAVQDMLAGLAAD